MNYRVEKDKILITLDTGDEIIDSIYKIVKNENISFGWLNAIGAIEEVTIGAYPMAKKKYIKKNLIGEYELVSLNGNITTKEGNPFVHVHVVVSDEECKAYGGHLFSATITATCEMILFKGDKNVFRTMNENIGLYLWDLNCEK